MQKYTRGYEVLQIMLDWLMEYNIRKWDKFIYKAWTIGRVALATPHGAKDYMLWSSNKNFCPIRWK